MNSLGLMIKTVLTRKLVTSTHRSACESACLTAEKENAVNKNRFAKFFNGRAHTTVAFGFLLTFVLGAVGTSSAQQSTNPRFRGGIGVVPVTGVAASGAANLNIVRAVNPAGPWRIADLDADVSSDGRIKVKGHGLLLAAGNGIGTNAGASVFATLFCGDPKTPTAHSSTPVALDADGDFKIDEILSPIPPAPCETPALLIRNAGGGGVWFAAGIPEVK
jgi:hypothetical protein